MNFFKQLNIYNDYVFLSPTRIDKRIFASNIQFDDLRPKKIGHIRGCLL